MQINCNKNSAWDVVYCGLLCLFSQSYRGRRQTQLCATCWCFKNQFGHHCLHQGIYARIVVDAENTHDKSPTLDLQFSAQCCRYSTTDERCARRFVAKLATWWCWVACLLSFPPTPFHMNIRLLRPASTEYLPSPAPSICHPGSDWPVGRFCNQ